MFNTRFELTLILTSIASATSIITQGPSRIYNGEDVTAGTYPWFVRFLNEYAPNQYELCGGSLIAEDWILTAAHCVDNHNIRYILDIGALCPNHSNNCGQNIEQKFEYSSSLTVHPSYDGSNGSFDYDFALLKLSNKVSITPVNIDDGSYSPNYSNGKEDLWSIGFGKEENGILAAHLQHVELKYLSYSECTKKGLYTPFQITENMLCASDDQGK